MLALRATGPVGLSAGIGTPGATRDDQRGLPPVPRPFVALGLTLPAARLRISLIAKLAHERARNGVYSRDPFQAPKQPCQHIRALRSTSDPWFGMRVLATTRPFPNGLGNIRPLLLMDN